MKELLSLNDDIENSQMHMNTKDIRPMGANNQSLFTNTTIANSTTQGGDISLTKKGKTAQSGNTLAINKSQHQ